MVVGLFLVAAVLSCRAGEASGESASARILVSAGEAVTLPCRVSVGDSGDLPTVEWSKDGLDQNIALLYRDGCETHAMKSPVFRYRTSLIMDELKNGNISLRISSVRLSDAGKYRCKTIRKKAQKVVTMELFVVAVSEPKLSVVPAVDGGVTLQCEANCWFPQPEITFLDEQGNDIRAENPMRDQDSRECFTVTRRATAQADSRVTCRVHQPDMNQTRVTEIHTPAMMSCSVYITTIIIIIIADVGIIILCGFGFLYKIFCISGQKSHVSGQSSDRSTTGGNAELHPSNQADDIGDAAAEHLRVIDELKLNLREKEEIICRQDDELNDLRSKRGPVVCQHDQPTIDNSPSKSSPGVSKPIIDLPPHHFPHDNGPKPAASTNSNLPKNGNLLQSKDSNPGVSRQNPAPGAQTQRSRHHHSSPALFADSGVVPVPPSSSSSTSASERSRSVRSMSFSGPRPRPDKLERRYTTSGNRFTVLADLPEDSQPLL